MVVREKPYLKLQSLKGDIVHVKMKQTFVERAGLSEYLRKRMN